MRQLVIDCASAACSVALFDGDALIAGEFHILGRGHAEALVPMIAGLPERGRADAIAVALGPGSFTGVRVGLAAARALALAWGAELQGYPSADLLAAMARGEHGAVPLAVAQTGGHGEWFLARYAGDGTVLLPATSMTPADAAAAAGEELVAGSEAAALVAARGHGLALEVWSDARAFALLPEQSLRHDTAPIYGREPDARLPGGARP